MHWRVRRGDYRELDSEPLGAGQLSLSSVVFFVIGGFVGIWIAYRLFA